MNISPSRWDYNALSETEKALWDAIAEAAMKDPFVFARYICGNDKMVHRVHAPMFKFMAAPVLASYDYAAWKALPGFNSDWDGGPMGDENVCMKWTGGGDPLECAFRRETRFDLMSHHLLIEAFRSSFKTTAVCSMILWLLVRDPESSIMVAGKTDGSSKATLGAVGKQIESNRILQHYWSGKQGLDWRADSPKWDIYEKTIGGRTRKAERSPSLWATGVGSFKPSYHFQYAFVDDVIDDKTVQSIPEIEAVSNFFSVLQPVLDPPAVTWVIGTPWDKLDMYEQLYNRRALNGHYIWNVYIRSARNPDGTYWFPERVDEKRMAEIHDEHRLKPWLPLSQYHMCPISDAENTLQVEKIDWRPAADMPAPETLYTFISIDPADTRGQGHGSWAIWALGARHDKHVFDLAHEKGRIDSKTATELVVKMCDKFKPKAIIIECTAISKNYIDATLKPALAEARKNGLIAQIPEVVEVSHGGEAKAYRIRNVENGLGGVIANGRLHAREENFALRTELSTFPGGEYTYDLLDAGAYLARVLGQRSYYPRPPQEHVPVEQLTWEQREAKEALAALDKRDSEAMAMRADLRRNPQHRWLNGSIRQRVEMPS
jgi:hypothetical protein